MKRPWAEPWWDGANPVHDWRNYISREVRLMWESFSDKQQAALYRQAADNASKEEWE